MSKQTENNKPATLENLPNLHEQQPVGISLVAEYWTPETVGETKYAYIIGISEDLYEKTDEKTGEVEEVILPCVFMIEQLKDGSFKGVKNGAKHLVAAIENAMKSGDIQTTDVYEKSNGQILPTGIKIEYLGKKKNKNNSYQSDRFDIRKLQ